jgi:hypothetical protein
MVAGVLALIGLTSHELRVERVVHSLEVRSDERQPGLGTEAAVPTVRAGR